ncbi:MAG: transporter substrate-binding domain-containing protein [Sneathiella sp.]|nr:transporter substrate-binding domain-containing protein [Sneathiella sp.]
MKILGILSVAAALAFTTTVSAETVTIANGNDYAPLADKNLKRGGIASHLVEEAFKAVGWTVKYDWLPWKRGFEMAKKAEIDAAIPWTRRDDRTPHFLFSDAIVKMREEVWAGAGSTIKSTEDLAGKTGCLPIGYSWSPNLKPLVESGAIKKDTPKDMTTCFKKLVAKRVDFVVVNNLQAVSIVKTTVKDPSSIKSVISSADQTELHVLVGKGHPKGAEIIAAFNKGLAALRSSGEYDTIVASH